MGVEENKALAREWFARCYAGNLEVIDELVAEDYVGQFNSDPPMHGREALRQGNAATQAAFPDLRIEVEDLVADGDRVAARYTSRGTHTGPFGSIPPTGKPFAISGITICRFRDGTLVEHWGVYDLLGGLQQLGVLPAPGQVPSQ